MTEALRDWIEEYINELNMIGVTDKEHILEVLMEDLEGHVMTIVEDHTV